MVNFSANNRFYRKDSFEKSVFWIVTLVMLCTRYLAFCSYSGADDLHYAFLSNNFLNGNYDFFVADDIYSARALVIIYQAIWFKIFGINDFSMCMPALSLLIITAYFICFKFGLQKNINSVVLGASLIYFNPVVIKATLGNLPDVYIALISALVFFLIKSSLNGNLKKSNIFWGVVTAALLVAGLFVKESIILIWAGAGVLLIYYRKSVPGAFVISMAVTLFIGFVAYLLFYYIHTGHIFYHLLQIKNSNYFNLCSYDCLPAKYLLRRLTITVPFAAMASGAYPLLLSTAVLLTGKRQVNPDLKFWKITFYTLILLALYFPFSVYPYIPLCHDMRQFFFIFPFATLLFLFSLQHLKTSANHVKIFYLTGSILFVLVTLMCVFFTPYNKWSIFCNCLLALVFIGNAFLNKKNKTAFLYLAIPFILWLGTAYSVIKKPNSGYAELKILQDKLRQDTNFVTSTFYFLNNDTKSHFALINQFDSSRQFFNLDTVQAGFKPFVRYQRQYAFVQTPVFKKGWLIVSGHFFENISAVKMRAIDHLLTEADHQIKVNKTTAYYVTSDATLKPIMDILNFKTADNRCY
jgi:hypothetical protein